MFFSSCAAAGQFAHGQSITRMHQTGCIKHVLALWLFVSAGVKGVIGQRSGCLKQGSENVETGTMSTHRQLERLKKAVCTVPMFLCVMFVAGSLAVQLAPNAGA